MAGIGIQKPQPRFDGADSASRFKTLVPCTSPDHQRNRSPAENRFTESLFYSYSAHTHEKEAP